MSFQDSDNQWQYDVKTELDSTYQEAHFADSDLGNFLSRPVQIDSRNWNVGSNIDHIMDPWSLFLTNPQVAARLGHYYLYRSKLKVKVVINGNSFFYGRLIAAYTPLALYNQSIHVVTTNDTNLVQLSQQPHIYIDPTLSQGGVLTLPYFYFRNWIDLTSTEYEVMGQIRLKSFAPLKHANGATEAVTITTFAWAEDVELCVPTTHNFVSQAEDEYEANGLISKPASAIAKVAGKLESVPVLSPYATATKTISSAVAGVARIFGFSRPPVIKEIASFKPCLLGNLAATDQNETVTKLTVDTKQELTVDPRTVGLSGNDEMSIAHIAQRESYYTQFGWAPSTGSGHILFSTAVNPCMFKRTDYIFDPTAVCFASQPFQYWSGTLKYRFQIVASEYHKGRLRVVYDPVSFDNTDLSVTYNTAYNRIVDLSQERDFEIDVSWAQAEPYKLVTVMSESNELYRSDGVPQISDYSHNNGTLTVLILNQLTTPNSTVSNSIQINVFVSAGEDFELCAPANEGLDNLSYFHPPTSFEAQAEDIEDENDASVPDGAQPIMAVGDTQPSLLDRKNLVFFGESIVSFRQLLKRYWYLSGSAVDPPADAFLSWRVHWANFPPYRGYDPQGIHKTVNGENYNYVKMVLLNYLAPAFIGYRGGIRYKYAAFSPTFQSASMSVTRRTNATGYGSSLNSYIKVGDTTDSQFSHSMEVNHPSFGSGAYVTPLLQQPVCEVELPFYSRFRFALPQHLSNTDGSSIDDTQYMAHTVDYVFHSNASEKQGVSKYVSIGEDFSFFFFLSAPRLFRYLTPEPLPN